jgi:hypothetical protein
MLAGVTAFELLVLVLVLGFIGALSGWAGGLGARLGFSARVDRVEGILLQLLNRAKGAAGGEVARQTRELQTSRMKEAEQLAAKLAQVPKRRNLFGRSLSPLDAAEEQSYAEIEAAKEARRAQEKAEKSAG